MTDFEILREDFENQTVFQSNFFWEIEVPEGFEDWFVKTGEYFKSSVKIIPNELKVRQTTASQCFHNSQLLCIENDNIDYYEGIIYGPNFKKAYHHGFNIRNDQTIDITYLNNIENFHNEDKRDNYYIYFGIKIPKNFILLYSQINQIPNQQHPIIIDYYNAILKSK